eukprot:scaffold4120_cov17-Prasinocladus_malaysianus.AAC.1
MAGQRAMPHATLLLCQFIPDSITRPTPHFMGFIAMNDVYVFCSILLDCLLGLSAGHLIASSGGWHDCQARGVAAGAQALAAGLGRPSGANTDYHAGPLRLPILPK